MKFPLEELRRVSYLNVERLVETGRMIKLLPLWDREKWYLWALNIEGKVGLNRCQSFALSYR